jgi:hypothetical protein
MDFATAQKLKSSKYPTSTLERHDRVFNVILAPSKGEDYSKFLEFVYKNYSVLNVPDETAHNFSSNGLFEIVGVRYEVTKTISKITLDF